VCGVSVQRRVPLTSSLGVKSPCAAVQVRAPPSVRVRPALTQLVFDCGRRYGYHTHASPRQHMDMQMRH
jgi:hypothetical protein